MEEDRREGNGELPTQRFTPGISPAICSQAGVTSNKSSIYLFPKQIDFNWSIKHDQSERAFCRYTIDVLERGSYIDVLIIPI